jgi:hypothetical protein
MRILCRFHGWLIFARVIALFMFVWPYVRNMSMLRSWPIKIPNMNKMRQTTNDLSCVHKMCEWTYGQTNMKRAITLAKINHPLFGILVDHDLSMRILCRFHGWLIFARVIALFMFVWPYVRPHILCTQLVICLLSHFIQIWYLGGPGQSRYQIWIKCNKRQMTSCVHKMCGRTYGQTNMKRAITLAKINHPWNQHNMRMLRSLSIKIPNMNKMRQKINQPFSCLFDHTSVRTSCVCN